MHHLQPYQFLGLLAAMLGLAKLLGSLAQRIGQPAVLGELLAGVLLGTSVLGLVDPGNNVLHLLSELGVAILLFEIGLEIDLRQLLSVGGTSTTVAVAGVVMPFALGYGVCQLLGLSQMESIVAGATLTATSVGITARVLSDLQRLREPESQIIVGAAVIDDVIGLVILAVVAGLLATDADGQKKAMSLLGLAGIAGLAFGFLVGTVLVGSVIVPRVVPWLSRYKVFGSPASLAVMLALGLAWLAEMSGSAMILGAFVAGLLLRETPQASQIEHAVARLADFFVPLFFVVVGAAVDVGVLNPLNPNNWQTLEIGGLLIVAAVVGKFAAGFVPFWFKGNKTVIGIGMIPRGEVGLLFAKMGLDAGVLQPGLFSAVTLMVMVTTFMVPPLLKLWFAPSDLTNTLGDKPAESAEQPPNHHQ